MFVIVCDYARVCSFVPEHCFSPLARQLSPFAAVADALSLLLCARVKSAVES